MYPLNHVVTNVHRIDIRRHEFNAEGIFVSEGFEGLAPPARAFEQCRTNGLRCSTIHVIDNRLDCFADTCCRIFLLQTMPRDIALGYWLLDRRCEVHVFDPEITGARIEHARLEAGRGQLHKRMALTHCDRFGYGDNLSDVLSRSFANKRQGGFHFCVLRKVLCVWKIKSAATRFEFIRSLLSSLQRAGDLMNVA